MKKNRSLFILSIFLLLSFSCNVYMPGSLNVPMLTNRGELQVSLSGGTGLFPQVSYAATNHIGILGSANFFKSGSGTNRSTQANLTLGLGYFGRWGKHGRYEFYMGGDGGKIVNKSSEFKFNDWFLQPTIGYTSNIVDLGLSSAFTLITFNDVKGAYLTPPKYSTIYWQPALTAKLGYKRVRFLGQLSLAVDMNKDPKISVFPFIMAVGINLNLGQSRYVKHTDPRYNSE